LDTLLAHPTLQAHPSSSYRNVTETEKLIELIETLVAPEGGSSSQLPDVSTNDIGIVTPFRAQVLYIRDMLRKRGYGSIRVGTVDDYQGQEERIIIISTVIGSANARSVGTMAHGLMSSPQRFNVAITRAKALLVIIGDPNALWEDDSWRALLEYAVKNHGYRGCAHPLASEGAGEDVVETMAALITQAAQRTLLGSANVAAMYPGLGLGGIWAGEPDDIDEEHLWRMF